MGKYPKHKLFLPVLERISWDRMNCLLPTVNGYSHTEWPDWPAHYSRLLPTPRPTERGQRQSLEACTQRLPLSLPSATRAQRLRWWGQAPTCVASQGSSRNDRLVLVEVSTVTHIVLEGALGLVVGQGSWVVLGVEAVIGGDALQAVERWLAAPGLGEAVTTIVALYALKRVLAPEFTWR